MEKKYRIVFLGLRENLAEFKESMFGLGVSADVVDRFVNKAPVVLKGNMTLGEAREYAEAVQRAGGRVNIQESGFFEKSFSRDKSPEIKPLGKFTMCPECGFKQLKAAFCDRCGFPLAKGEGGDIKS